MHQPPTPPYDLSKFPLIDTLRLIRSQNVGSVTFFRLLQKYGTPGKALEAIPELAKRGGSKKPLVAFSKSKAETEIEKTELYGARMVVFGEADYPAWLTTINDPPPILTILGTAQHWKSKNCIGIVGARNASANGCAFAKMLAKQLGEQDLTVVSGLARGIDTFAHNGALSTGTVGVVASGIDVIYPPENKDLYAKMADLGAIISEQPLGQAPFNTSFPSRNRIIAGMSLGTVVVEAAMKSGSLITAKNALDYNREVFAVPGSPLDPRARGCNQLIKDGAVMVENADDIIRNLRAPQVSLLDSASSQFDAGFAAEPDEQQISCARELVLEKLGFQPVSIDEVMKQCDISAAIMLTVLLELELAARITRHPGGQVCLSSKTVMEELF